MSNYGVHLASRLDQANGRLSDLQKEVSRLRAALASIEALQPCEPDPDGFVSTETRQEVYGRGVTDGQAKGRYEASSLAAKALGGGT